jgi:hypothetical protein
LLSKIHSEFITLYFNSSELLTESASYGGLQGGAVPVTVTANLPKPAVEVLQQLAAKRKTTSTEILRHAISLEKQLEDELSEGARILIEKEGTLSSEKE